MQATKSSAPRNHSLQITRQDKFYSRLLSRESSLANPSFRVYYGGASGSVPFLWESQPGTPKNAIATSTLPPLTPPPSYHSDLKKKHAKRSKANPSGSRLIHCLLPRLTQKKANLLFSQSSPSPSSLPLSSPSVSSSRSSGSNRRSRYSSPRSSFSSKADEEEESGDEGSPTSTLCYKVSQEGRGCYSMVFVKKALLSIVGGSHGSNQGTHA